MKMDSSNSHTSITMAASAVYCMHAAVSQRCHPLCMCQTVRRVCSFDHIAEVFVRKRRRYAIRARTASVNVIMAAGTSKLQT